MCRGSCHFPNRRYCINILIARVSTNKSEAVDRLHNLSGSSEFHRSCGREAFARPRFQPPKPLVGVAGLTGLMIFTPDNQDFMGCFASQSNVMMKS